MGSQKKFKLLVNAGSLFSGGTLSIAHEILNDFINSNKFDIYCIVNDPKLFNNINVNYITINWIKSSWLHRLYFEIFYINFVIKEYNFNLLFNCHDFSSFLFLKKKCQYL